MDDLTTPSEAGPPPSPRGRGLLVVASVVVVLLLGAVAAVALGVGRDGDDGDGEDQGVEAVDLASVVERTQADTAKTVVVQEYRGGPSVRVEGEIDFRRRAVQLHGRLGMGASSTDDLPPEAMPEPFRKTFEVMEAADGLIVIGDEGWLHSGSEWWSFGGDVDQAGGEIDVFSPRSIVDQVGKLGEVETVGSEEVRGANTTHLRATDGATGDRFDLWVDQAGQLVRIVRTYDDPERGELATETTDLFDYGTEVAIRAPADAKPLDPFAEGGPDGGPDVTTHEVATGNDHGLSWTLLAGELVDGRRCVAVVTDASLDAEVVQIAADGTSSTSADVRAGTRAGPSCGPESDVDQGGSGAKLLTVGGKRGTKHYLAGLLAKGADVTVTFPDGRVERLEDHGGAFILVFSGDDWPTLMSGGNATCELQGDATTSGTDDVC